MPKFVCKGARLKCLWGSQESDLDVIHPVNDVSLGKSPIANIMDNKPMMNVKPFGQCKSLMNPVVAAATAANYGVLKEMPCLPGIVAPWMPGNPTVLIKGQPALMDNCKLTCIYGGMIQITNHGQ